MRFARYYADSAILPAFVDKSGALRRLDGVVADITVDSIQKITAAVAEKLPVVAGAPRLAPCVANIGKVIAIGKNYPEHARETGASTPKEPIIFLKATSSLSGANDPILRPRGSTQLDWEVELAVIIGKPGNYIEEKNAFDHIAAYATGNDVSERTFQLERSGQWTKGKSCDTFCPLGPTLVTADEINDPQNLNLWCSVNGVKKQNGNTRDMTFKIPFLISYASQFMRLEAGDVILTGTPDGVGKGQQPPHYLQPGDVLECGVEGLGDQRHVIEQA